MKKFDRNLKRAIEVSKLSDFDRARVGAVVADSKGNILAEGCNIRKTHPMQGSMASKAATLHGRSRLSKKTTLHAEIATIIKAMKSGKPYTIYVARTLKDGSCGIAKPCEICTLAIEDADIRNIVYTNDSDFGFSYTVVER